VLINRIHDLFNIEYNEYRADVSITASNRIGDGSEIYYTSKSILLDDLFEVQLGSIFEAKIGGCPL
jgi:hypothetical protein